MRPCSAQQRYVRWTSRTRGMAASLWRSLLGGGGDGTVTIVRLMCQLLDFTPVRVCVRAWMSAGVSACVDARLPGSQVLLDWLEWCGSHANCPLVGLPSQVWNSHSSPRAEHILPPILQLTQILQSHQPRKVNSKDEIELYTTIRSVSIRSTSFLLHFISFNLVLPSVVLPQRLTKNLVSVSNSVHIL